MRSQPRYLDGREQPTSRFTSGALWIGESVDPQIRSGHFEEGKSISCYREFSLVVLSELTWRLVCNFVISSTDLPKVIQQITFYKMAP